MTNAEKAIMRHFRQYQVGVNEILCFNTMPAKSNTSQFQLAMSSLIRNGLVIKERRQLAYSLTPQGFTVSQSV